MRSESIVERAKKRKKNTNKTFRILKNNEETFDIEYWIKMGSPWADSQNKSNEKLFNKALEEEKKIN